MELIQSLPVGFQWTLVFIFGSLLGSFSNVVIYRWPREESVVYPGSKCRSTGKSLPWYDNIPILSFLILRGKSRFDGSAISPIYPIVEIYMGLLFVVIFAFHGFSITTVELMIFGFLASTAAIIDAFHFLLPDILQYPGIFLALTGAFLNPEREFQSALIGSIGGGLFLYTIAKSYMILRKEEGMGLGDVKLIIWIGALIGWEKLPMLVLFSSLSGLAFGVVAMARGDSGMKTQIPFGPFLAGSAFIIALFDLSTINLFSP